jgi:hypothetical protein
VAWSWVIFPDDDEPEPDDGTVVVVDVVGTLDEDVGVAEEVDETSSASV